MDPLQKTAYFLTALFAFTPPCLLLMAAHGLVRGQGWARWGTLAALVGSLASLVVVQYLLFANGDEGVLSIGERMLRAVSLDLVGAVPVIIGVGYYLTRPHVAAAFGSSPRARSARAHGG